MNHQINVKDIKGIIFDLDGTLYSQLKMHICMFFDIFTYYLIHPLRINDLRIIYYFRKKRYEADSSLELEKTQYQITADYLNLPTEEVRSIIEKWILNRPIRYMKICRYSNVLNIFKLLRKINLKIAVVSDYPIDQKLVALGLTADVKICSTDPEVNAFKPNPKGLILACEKMELLPEECLVIGDRDDKDGEAARRGQIPYLNNIKQLTALLNGTSGQT